MNAGATVADLPMPRDKERAALPSIPGAAVSGAPAVQEITMDIEAIQLDMRLHERFVQKITLTEV